MHEINNTNSGAGDVESMATNLAIGDVLKIKMKEKKMKKKSNIKIESLKEEPTTVDRRGVGHRKTAIIKNSEKQKRPLMEMEIRVTILYWIAESRLVMVRSLESISYGTPSMKWQFQLQP